MRESDAAVLFLGLTGLLVAVYQESDLTASTSFIHHSKADNINARHTRGQLHERIPPPIVTDLDGDGTNEIVVVTRDKKVQILDGSTLSLDPSAEYLEVQAKHEASLKTAVHISNGRTPVAVSTGYVSAYRQGRRRNQVIVVVTEEWEVLCFNHNLKLLWESTVKEDHSGDKNYFHKEVSIVVAPVNVQKNDRGVVIVGGRLEYDPVLGAEKLAAKRVEHGNDNNPEQGDVSGIGHFSYHAFEGSKGAKRWSHTANSFHEEYDKYSAQHNYKIDARSHSRHIGELDWRAYRTPIMHLLPHRWTDRDDTHLSIAHFSNKASHRNEREKLKAKPTEDAVRRGLPTHKIPMRAPHNSIDLIEAPNVVIGRQSQGLEVLHVYTGQELCKITLETNVAHVDLNRDGIIDHIGPVTDEVVEQRLRKDETRHIEGCLAIATSGVPESGELFNSSVCASHSVLDRFMNTFAPSEKEEDVGMHTLAPVLLERHEDHNVHSDPTYDSVFFVNTGRVTALTHDGFVRWQVDTAAEWMSASEGMKHGLVMHSTVHPSINVFSTYAYGRPDAVLAVGADHFTVISSQGKILVSMDLGEHPVGPVTFGDFNSDGVTDVVFTTKTGLMGVALKTRPGAGFLVRLLALLLIAIVVVFVSQKLPDADDSQYHRSPSSAKRKL